MRSCGRSSNERARTVGIAFFTRASQASMIARLWARRTAASSGLGVIERSSCDGSRRGTAGRICFRVRTLCTSPAVGGDVHLLAISRARLITSLRRILIDVLFPRGLIPFGKAAGGCYDPSASYSGGNRAGSVR